MSKKIILLSLVAVFLFTDLLALASTGRASSSPEISKEEFVNLLVDTSEYNEYKPYFVYDDPVVINPLLDEDKEQFGWIAQYEVDLNMDQLLDDYLQFNSLLTFLYSFEEQAFEVVYLDYSNVHNSKELIYTNLRTGENDIIDVSDMVGLSDAIDEANNTVLEEFEDQSGEISLMSNQICWVCFEYETISHSLHGTCATIIGLACTIPNFSMFGRVVCAGATIISCWVPGYRKCVRGQMQPVCP
ncbi:hypothetical protein AWH56_008620 [Anaerobacillus isosaccharinicus]|uniref:Uncharacterized protein n=1 Tax=Anaerobacillus isosaccharinicus TaxID=1532552 RepID=A0A1S2L3D9_9BACI|nr:hypothetical protein [Anaerobacillus isosaccharinicus]MBA5583953.1 hypothetical protein [Anaerobacillus isosaccharinicus]QOY37628.1 hypothetical protein AWH56_008620 [Anaerobacillus isosaccharinicus]